MFTSRRASLLLASSCVVFIAFGCEKKAPEGKPSPDGSTTTQETEDTSALPVDAPPEVTLPVIEAGGVGTLRVGGELSSAKLHVIATVDGYAELTSSEDGFVELVALGAEKITSIGVLSQSYRTEKGLHPGARASAIADALGAPTGVERTPHGACAKFANDQLEYCFAPYRPDEPALTWEVIQKENLTLSTIWLSSPAQSDSSDSPDPSPPSPSPPSGAE